MQRGRERQTEREGKARSTCAWRNGRGRRQTRRNGGEGARAKETLRETYTGVDVHASNMQLVVGQKQGVFPPRHFFLCLPGREGHLHSTFFLLKIELLLLMLFLLRLLQQGASRGAKFEVLKLHSFEGARCRGANACRSMCASEVRVCSCTSSRTYACS